MTRFRIVIAVFALVGAVIGAGLGYLLAPEAHRYTASANVAVLPAANLTTEEASSFWDVLTRGQVGRTAAVLYDDPRWLPSAANAAKVPESELTLTAAALPETTMVSVTVTARSPAAAESALNDVLTTATGEVTSLTAPYAVKVIWPPKGSATPVPIAGRSQLAAAGALGGLLVGGALAWFGLRSRIGVNALARSSLGVAADAPLPSP
jgi:capsular polysaccharide biosynthesis protein